MPKVVIDSDIIEQNLIPLTKNALSKMSDVVSSANGVYFPYDDFISNIKDKTYQSLLDAFNKYLSLNNEAKKEL